MSDHDPNWDLEKVYPSTRDLVEAIACDDLPGAFTMVVFDLATQEHYEAIFYPLKNWGIAPSELDDAILNGPGPTELARSAPEPMPRVPGRNRDREIDKR